MKLTLKNVFLSVGIFAFTLALVGALSTSQAEAAAISSTAAGGAFADTATWVGGVVPSAADDITIVGTATVTVVDDTTDTTGSIVIDAGGTLNVSGTLTVTAPATVTNNGTVSITTALAGNGEFINGATGTLNLVGTSTITTLTATAGGNTVNYTGAGQTVKDTLTHTYHHLGLSGSGAKVMTGITTIAGNFSMSGSATATPVITTIGGNLAISGTAVMTTGANDVVAGSLSVGAGSTLTLGGFSLSIGTTSSISGTVNTATAATGTKTFTGLVTVASGGIFDLSGQNPVAVFSAGITNNSATAFNAGTNASNTLVGNLGGTGAITFGGPLAISSGTTTNNNTGTVTVTGTLTLTGAWTQATNSTLVLGSTTPFGGAGVLTAAATGNTVTYAFAGAQTVKAPAVSYYNLTFAGSGAKTVGAGLTILGTLVVGNGTTGALTGDTTADALTLGNVGARVGSWGSTASSAKYKTNDFFSGTGKVTAATGRNIYYAGDIDSSVTTDDTTTTTTSSSTTSTDGSTTTTTTTTTTTPGLIVTAVPAVPATPGNTIVGCGNRTTGFSTASGVSCAGNSVTAPATPASKTYNFGTAVLKNGSRGEAVMELQRFLNAKLNLGLVVDGKLGPKTIAVVKKWQKDNGLVADGLIGPKTKALMNK